MKAFFRQMRDWSNANQGLLALFAVIISLVGLIPFQRLDITGANSFFETFLALITYPLRIPVYIFLAILVAISLFAVYLTRRKPRSSPSAGKILVGTWQNKWGSGQGDGTEVAQITRDGKYIINDRHLFNIHHFRYNHAKRELRFVKVGLGGDYRRLYNILTVQSDELLVGTENNYPIKYSKLS